MQSAENGFKKYHLIPFSQKNQEVVAASPTSREEYLSSTVPSLKEKISFMYTLHTCAFIMQGMTNRFSNDLPDLAFHLSVIKLCSTGYQ